MRGARQEPAFSWGRERGARLTPVCTSDWLSPLPRPSFGTASWRLRAAFNRRVSKRTLLPARLRRMLASVAAPFQFQARKSDSASSGKASRESAERLVSAGPVEDDSQFELKLRPKRLAEFIGQSKAKEQLAIALEAAKSRGEALDHVLLFGPPGLGKTTLA